MHHVTEGEDLLRILHWMGKAIEAAPLSECRKSTRGVAIVKDGVLLSSGHIRHPDPDHTCVRLHIHNNALRSLCGSEHAEAFAIRTAKERGISLTGATLYHMKVKNGIPAASGPPSCELCSAKILAAGISEVVLWHDEGYTAYRADEFDRLSRRYAESAGKS